jgi:hypothetical protein
MMFFKKNGENHLFYVRFPPSFSSKIAFNGQGNIMKQMKWLQTEKPNRNNKNIGVLNKAQKNHNVMHV